MTEDQQKRLREVGDAALASLIEMADALIAAEKADDWKAREDAERTIHEDPLSLQIRSDWYEPGKKPEPAEFELLLTTGGPAVRLIGDLDGGQPSSVELQVQDWFLPWTRHPTTPEETEKLLRYASCFYYAD